MTYEVTKNSNGPPETFIRKSLNEQFYDHFKNLYEENWKILMRDSWPTNCSFWDFKNYIMNSRFDCERCLDLVYETGRLSDETTK